MKSSFYLSLMIILSMFVSLFSMPSSASASACTYFVATNGKNSNPGTRAAPWRTIQKAANTVPPGSVVCVRGGVYNEVVVIKVSGSAEAPITFQSLRAAINKRFMKYETSVSEKPAMAIWRVTDPGSAAGISAVTGKPQTILAIQVANADDDTVRVIYMLGRTRPCPSGAEK